MGKKLAIRGHLTRGKEVIELLQMMGGKNIEGYIGIDCDEFYTIEGGYIIQSYDWNDCLILSLEEFLEKYPFKVGDKVVDCYGTTITIKSMAWSEDCESMVYDFEDSVIVLAAEDLLEYNNPIHKITHEDVIFDSIIWHLRNSVNNGKQNLSGGVCEDYFRELVKKNNENKMKSVLAELLEYIKTTPKEDLEREFEEIKEWSNVGPTVEEFMTFCECVNKKPIHPNDYKTCCDVLYANSNHNECYEACLRGYPMETFARLLICRDAYRKIYGEVMGLGEPWEPDWTNEEQNKYCICYGDGNIQKSNWRVYNSILAFPTEEMRDAFYENFKDLIEQCKELL